MPPIVYKLNKGTPEPLSRRALRHLRAHHKTEDEANLLVFRHMESEQLKRIVYELLRYCQGEIDGISVLVAGQRGAGKTTLVKLAIQKVMQQSTALIPLPLMLHGPTVIDPHAAPPKPPKGEEAPPLAVTAGTDGAPVIVVNTAPAPAPPTNGGAKKNGAEKEDKDDAKAKAKQRALHQIVTALYRALSLAIYEAWANAALEAPARRSAPELLALRAHLDLRLEQRVPDADVLRKIWERAGFLQRGVAFHLRPVRKNAANRMWRDTTPPDIAGHPHDQGVREIVALASCADAYKVIISKAEETLGRKQESEYSQELRLSAPPSAEKKTKEENEGKAKSTAEKAAPPLLATAAGGLAGLAAHADQSLDTLAIGIATAVLVWLGSFLAMNYGTRSSRQEMRRELKLDIKWDIDRLERDLPLLLKRVKDAGFAPIFVLDELDKAEHAKESLHNFLELNKHIVTDQAAFMFLTNRDYYERLITDELIETRKGGREPKKNGNGAQPKNGGSGA